MANETFFFKVTNNEPLVKLIIAPQEHMEDEYNYYRGRYPDDAIGVMIDHENTMHYAAMNDGGWNEVGNEADDPEWFNQVLTMLAPYRVTEKEACR